MPSVNEQLDEQSISADAPAGEIAVPTILHGEEVLWYGIVAHATQDIRLVKTAGDTQGQLIPAASGLNVLGPYRMVSVLNGKNPRFLHSDSLVTIQVVVNRSG